MGQQEFDLDSMLANDPCFNRPPTTDLMDDNYWCNYLKAFRKESIYHDTTFSEVYRLLYWGNYFAIVEVSVSESRCYVVADSMNWTNDDVIYRMMDTIPFDQTILNIRSNCNLMWEYDQEIDYSLLGNDDRDNWAFEYKIDDCYMSLKRYDVEEPLKNVILDIMRIGKLKGFTVHRIKESSIEVN